MNRTSGVIAHKDCWDLAVAAKKTPGILYYYAAMIRKIAPPRSSPPPYESPHFAAQVSTKTPLGKLLAKIATMPVLFFGNVRSLFVETQRMFGLQYIRRINFNQRGDDFVTCGASGLRWGCTGCAR